MKCRHHVQAALPADARRFFARFLEVMAMLDQRDAERTHRRVLLDAVAARHVHGGR